MGETLLGSFMEGMESQKGAWKQEGIGQAFSSARRFHGAAIWLTQILLYPP